MAQRAAESTANESNHANGIKGLNVQRHRFAVFFQTEEVAGDGVLDVVQRRLARAALGNAAGHCGIAAIYRVIPPHSLMLCVKPHLAVQPAKPEHVCG